MEKNLSVQELKDNLCSSLQLTSFGHVVQQIVPPAMFVALACRLQGKVPNDQCFSHTSLSASAGIFPTAAIYHAVFLAA